MKRYITLKNKYTLYSSLVLIVLFFSVRITFYDKQAEIAAKSFLILVEKREYALAYLLLSNNFQDNYPYWQFIHDMTTIKNALGIINLRYGKTNHYFRISFFQFSRIAPTWSGEFVIIGKNGIFAEEEMSVIKEDGEYKIATYFVKDRNPLKAKNIDNIISITSEELVDIKKLIVRTKNTLKSLINTSDMIAELIIGEIIYEGNPRDYREIEKFFSYFRNKRKTRLKKSVKFGIWSKFLEFNILKYTYKGKFQTSKFLPNNVYDEILVYDAQVEDRGIQYISIFFFCNSGKILDIDYYKFSMDAKSSYFIARKESYLKQLSKVE